MTAHSVTIANYGGGASEAAFDLVVDGLLDGTIGDVSDFEHAFAVETVRLEAAGQTVLRAKLPEPIELPVGILYPPNGQRLRTRNELDAALTTAAQKVRFRARYEDDVRRLRMFEVDWADTSSAFLGVAATALAKGRVAFEGDLYHDSATLRVAFFAAFEASVGSLKRSFGLVCAVQGGAAATLSLELGDFNLSLPPVKLPSFNLPTLKLDLPGGSWADSRLAQAFAAFADDLELTYTWAPANPVLVMRPANGGLAVAVMKPALTDAQYDAIATAISPADLASLNVDIETGAGAVVSISGVKFGAGPSGSVFEGTATAGATKIGVPDGERRLGPLVLQWHDVTVDAVTTAVPINGHNIADKRSARAEVTFGRLKLALADDPATVICLSGVAELTASGARLVTLKIVEPYPYELIVDAAGGILAAGEKVFQFLARLNAPSSDLSGLKKILGVLGRMAAAIGRAAVFVAEDLAKLAQLAGDMLASAVVKIAEALEVLFKELANLLDGASAPSVDIEVRISLEPVELRQVMLTFRKGGVEPSAVQAAGFDLQVPTGWHLAVLFDFVTNPGAYLLAIPDSGTAPLGILATDLWLRTAAGERAEVLRDADSETGDRGDERLLKLTVKKTSGPEAAIVVAGLSRGKTVFLKKAVQELDKRKIDGVDLRFVAGPFQLQPLEHEIDVDVAFKPERVLPLLGMGEPGKDVGGGGADGFLDRLKDSLGQVVTVRETGPIEYYPKKRAISAGLKVDVQVAGLVTQAVLTLNIDLDDFEATLDAAAGPLSLKSKRIEEHALGLVWVVEQTDETARKEDTAVEMFRLSFSGGETGFSLNESAARMEVRVPAISSDGVGLVFKVKTFKVGRGGLDLVAEVSDRPVRMNGLDVPFRFTKGRLVIQSGRLVEATIAGRGQLPPDLIGDANCAVALTLGQDEDGIGVKAAKVEIEKKGEPIVSHGTRFTLTLSEIELGFAKENGYHFFFLVTGLLRFTPKSGEFDDGLLKYLDGVEIALEKAPLTSDIRVLANHLHFQKALNPKKAFPLFNIFTFELRGFGFHPASPKFEGKPAVNISGQIQFAEIGDVMQPKIDFHGLWIAPPREGESLPRIRADGLGLDLQLSGSVRVRGSVLAVDPDTRTVEGREIAPPGYQAYGFLGEGGLEIPGWGAMQAAIGLLEVAPKARPNDRKKAFFLYLQKDKMAVEIPTGFWTFYMREVGFGFGYRYTLKSIAEADRAQSAAQLITVLDEASKTQGDLARFSAWSPDPEKDNFTLALRAAFQPYPAEQTWDQTKEEKAVSPFFFDVIAAIRSDLTLLMSARGWLGVNYNSFIANKGDFRGRPGFRGYLYISAPRSELLMRGIADSTGYVGDDWPEVRKGQILRQAVESVDWSTTLYIRPGLFHYEMGWPDQLVARIADKPDFRLKVWGGMIFRAAEDGILNGFNIGAEAYLNLGAL
jgi:hypothetical protein